MGGAYASIATGAEAAFWNPAGIEATKGTEITASHYELYQKLRSEQFAVAGRMLGWGVSASVRALYSEPIEERDEIGNLTGSFGAQATELHNLFAGPSVWSIGAGLLQPLFHAGELEHKRRAKA